MELIFEAVALQTPCEQPLEEFFAEHQRDPASPNQAQVAILEWSAVRPSSVVPPGAPQPGGAPGALDTEGAVAADGPCGSIAGQPPSTLSSAGVRRE